MFAGLQYSISLVLGYNALWYALQSRSILSVILLTNHRLGQQTLSSLSIVHDMDNRGTSLLSWAANTVCGL